LAPASFFANLTISGISGPLLCPCVGSNGCRTGFGRSRVTGAQNRLRLLKARGFQLSDAAPDAFGIRREWFLLGRQIHCFYPSTCPDQPIRLYQREKVGYAAGKLVHEAPSGHHRTAAIPEPIFHYTCDTVDQMYAKLNQYTTLAALDMHLNGIRSNWLKISVYPWLLWLKFYFGRGGWRDGWLGLVHGRYVRDVVWQKYVKLKYDFEPIPDLRVQKSDRRTEPSPT
jgi:hypothetical protein